jgi:hypothetical protein
MNVGLDNNVPGVLRSVLSVFRSMRLGENNRRGGLALSTDAARVLIVDYAWLAWSDLFSYYCVLYCKPGEAALAGYVAIAS